MTHGSQDFGIGAWCWHERHAAPCRVVDREEMWGETAYRVWLPGKDAVVRARSRELGPLGAVRTTVDQILHTAAAAKLLDALEDNLVDPRNLLQQKISPINAYWYHNRSCIRRSLWITTKIICLLITLACLAARQHKTSVEMGKPSTSMERVGSPPLALGQDFPNQDPLPIHITAGVHVISTSLLPKLEQFRLFLNRRHRIE